MGLEITKRHCLDFFMRNVFYQYILIMLIDLEILVFGVGELEFGNTFGDGWEVGDVGAYCSLTFVCYIYYILRSSCFYQAYYRFVFEINSNYRSFLVEKTKNVPN